MNEEEEYDYSKMPACCGQDPAEYYCRKKKGQLVASCAVCGRYLMCVPKRRQGRVVDSATLIECKAASLGSEYCQMCLRQEESSKNFWIAAHHILPVAQGGSDDPSNIMLLCRDCHDIVHSIRRMHGTNNESVGVEKEEHKISVGPGVYNPEALDKVEFKSPAQKVDETGDPEVKQAFGQKKVKQKKLPGMSITQPEFYNSIADAVGIPRAYMKDDPELRKEVQEQLGIDEDVEGGEAEEVAFKIVGPNGEAKDYCEECGRVFEDKDEAIATLHINRGEITLCEECYRKMGNNVR